MARIRTIKPEFFRHRRLYLAEVETGLPIRVAFAGLWTVADREGRFRWEPEELKLDCLPYDDVDFSRVLDALASRGFVLKYVTQGRLYGMIPGFSDHQVINNKEAASRLPAPSESLDDLRAASRALRVPDATPTRPDLSQGEGKGRELEGKGREPVPSERAAEPPLSSPAALEKQLWDSAKAFLEKRDIPKSQVGGLVGRWLKAIGPPDSKVHLLRVLASAEANAVGDVVPYIETAIARLNDERLKGGGGKPPRIDAAEQRRLDNAAVFKVMGLDVPGDGRSGSGFDREAGPFGLAGGGGEPVAGERQDAGGASGPSDGLRPHVQRAGARR